MKNLASTARGFSFPVSRADGRPFRVRPRVAAQMLGMLSIDYSPSILAWLKKNYTGVNANLGLSDDQIKTALRKIREHYTAGGRSDRAGHVAARDFVTRELGWSDDARRRGVLGLLFFIEEMTDPLHLAWIKSNVSSGTYVDAVRATAGRAGAAVREGVQDTAREYVATVATGIRSGLDTASAILPWYANPKILIPVGLAAAAWVYLRPLLPAPRRPKYQKNPIEKKEKAAKKYEEFHAMPPTKRRAINEIDTSELVDLGRALEIGYKSKKWTGKNENYLHKFGPRIRVYATADGDALVLAGGDLDVQSRGIVG